MSDTDVSVTISADATGVQAGTEAASAAVGGFGEDVASISAAIRAQTEAMAEGFAEMAAIAREGFVEVEASEERAEEGMLGLLTSFREGAESITEMREAVTGFGEALLAVFAFEEVKEFVEQLGEAGERVQHTAQAFGLTTGEVQRLQAVFTAAGAGPEVLGQTFARLDRASSEAVSGNKKAADAFKDLGVNLAEPATSAQRMQQVLEGFANIQGPQRAAVAMAVFGRGIMQIAPLLGLTKESLAEYNAEADKYGAVNEGAIGHMAALGAALNESKVAFSGLQNVIGDALSGAFIVVIKDIDDFIASCVQSYQQGGLVRSILSAIATTIEVVAEVFETVGQVFASVWNAFTGQSAVAGQALELFRELMIAFGAGVVTIGAAIRITFDIIGGAINVLEDDFRTLGDVANAAMHLSWGGIQASWQAGLDRVHQIVRATTQQIKGDVADAAAAVGRLTDPANPSEASPTATASTPVKLGGEKKDKKPKDDLVSEWSEQLRQLQDQQANWYADQNKLAADFWGGIVAKAQGSAKDQQEARERLAEANKALDAEDVDSAIQAASKKAEAAKGNVDQVQAVYAALEATLRARHAEGGDDWRKVEEAKTEAVRKATQEQLQDQERVWEAAAKSQQSTIQTQGTVGGLQLQGRDQKVSGQESSGQISAREALAARVEIASQEFALEQQTAQRIYQSKVDELDREATAEAANAEKVKAIRQQIADAVSANDNRVAVEAQQNANKIAQIQQQAAQKVEQSWRQGINGAVSSFTSGLLQMGEKGTSLQSVMMNVGNSIANTFLQAIDKMITGWLTQLAIAVGLIPAQTAATNVPQITSAAQVAAANTFAATSAIPIIGPELAPAAAAAAEVQVLSFAAFSAAGGFDIPSGVNPVTQLHAQEMVLPSSIANPLRGMIAANGNSAGGAGGGGGGDTYHTSFHSLDSRSVRRLMNDPANLRSASKAAGRVR